MPTTENMPNYFDKWKRLHDKPCIDGEPSSNNGWTYLAYGLKTGFVKSLDRITLMALDICWKNKTRHPENNTVPFLSRDEMLGLMYLNPSYCYELIGDWWMTNDKPKFNLVRFIKQLILLIKNRDQRNYWWKNNLDQMKFLTMKVPLTDRCFYYRLIGKKAPLIYRLIEWIDKKMEASGRSSRAIRSFKYNQDNYEGIMLYFELDHPLRKYLEKRI